VSPAGGTLALRDFLGGYNSQNDALDLAANESPDLRNLTPIGTTGAVRARRGDLVVAGGAMPFAPDMLQYINTTGETLLIDSSSGRITSVKGATRNVLRAATAGTVPACSFAEAPVNGGQGPVYGIVQGGGINPAVIQMPVTLGVLQPAAAWTATLGGVPGGRFLLWAGNRMWSFGDGSGATPDWGHQYWWSDLGNPRSWPATNINTLDPGDGDHISAVAAIGSSIIVFKQHKAWQIYDLDTGANRQLTFGVGCVDRFPDQGHRVNLAVTTSQGVVFIDPDQGLMLTDGSSVKRLDPRRRVDPFVISGCASIVASGDSVFYGLANGDILEFDLIRDVWWRHDGGGVLTAAPTVASLALGSLTAANIYKTTYGAASLLDVFQGAAPGVLTYSSGAPLATRYTSPWLTAGSPSRLKRYGPAFVQGAAAGAINATIRHGLDPATWATRSLPFTGAASEKTRANELGVTEALQLQIDGVTLLESIELDYLARGRR
jgi:hypothetical protein